MHDPLCIEYNSGQCVCDLIKRVRGSDHDPLCDATYKHLIPVAQCRSCAQIRLVREDSIQSGIKKWEEDVSLAYWQGYNNALIEKDIDDYCPCCKDPEIDYWEGYNNTVINKESDEYKKLMNEREKSIE